MFALCAAMVRVVRVALVSAVCCVRVASRCAHAAARPPRGGCNCIHSSDERAAQHTRTPARTRITRQQLTQRVARQHARVAPALRACTRLTALAFTL